LDTRLTQLFANQPQMQRVWMSHGDDVHVLPPQFSAVCHTEDGVIAAVAHREKPIYGLQYHPEVHHTEFGAKLLETFARKICDAPVNWRRSDMLQAAINAVRSDAAGKKVLVACSGGVDSTVTAAICAQALGPENVSAVLCDHGFMRKDEVPWVVESLHQAGLPKIEVLDRSSIFLERLSGISDPEQKRKIIGRTFIEVFEDYARNHTFSFLAQGTLYPDVIESAGHGSGAKVIKSHHNVGGLPDKLKLPLLEPFRYLFKDEVRAVGEQLGLPSELVHRHPFPGPGLAIRIMGEVTKPRLELLRAADHVFINALRNEGHYDKVWQAFAVLLPIKTVGVMGDNRTYQDTLALRAVSAIDAMTAEVGELPISFLSRTAADIVKKVDGINRVVYDITTKPPATIEWE
jgi:GMP synthase (glutamine-hydrolysing)